MCLRECVTGRERVCVCVCVWMCVGVSVCGRERKRERDCVRAYVYLLSAWWKHACWFASAEDLNLEKRPTIETYTSMNRDIINRDL